MPHDANGQLLEVGDLVNLPARVVAIHTDGPYCNLDIELVHPMPAYPDQKARYSALNPRQVEKA